jgi:2-polyprenyl-6-hydroxyphenyl methylase/3-demethylubiquinone-9 3-methyltransferase
MGNDQYYTESLSAERLKRCYDIAPPRTIQYLEAEIRHALKFISSGDRVLELGCGYGRVLERVQEKTKSVTGIDTSFANIIMAKRNLDADLYQMNARALGFADDQFDVVLCLQNGISAFKVNPVELMRESIRVTKPSGVCLFSSYSSKFWNDRLKWFELQSEEGLLGEIDYVLTRDENIVCKDGFISTTYRPDEFVEISKELGYRVKIVEVDESSLFCEVYLSH